MSIIDKTIEYFAPETALRRETARRILNSQRAYEAAKPSRLRKTKTDSGSGDTILERAGNLYDCKLAISMKTMIWPVVCWIVW